jgi:predicted metal-dependent enzyme (double-stranded beta helix superfamily)
VNREGHINLVRPSASIHQVATVSQAQAIHVLLPSIFHQDYMILSMFSEVENGKSHDQDVKKKEK